eukprot:scaffold333_cov133-Cylindrotheca_fusiformis.AAC.1
MIEPHTNILSPNSQFGATAMPIPRHLRTNNSDDQGRAVLTIIYLAVLSLCFIIPLCYYCRMRFERSEARRLRELEFAALAASLQQSEDSNRDESRAARKKCRDEQRARIVQLFSTCQKRLERDDFPHLRKGTKDLSSGEQGGHCVENDDEVAAEHREENDIEGGNQSSSPELGAIDEEEKQLWDAPGKQMDCDSYFVEIPASGLAIVPNSKPLRLVQNLCPICLCNYEIGTMIVWSSNEACEHAFHFECIEEWLMNQREGPLCPCCRRDFIIDPFDLDGEEECEKENFIQSNDPQFSEVEPDEAFENLAISESTVIEVPGTEEELDS